MVNVVDKNDPDLVFRARTDPKDVAAGIEFALFVRVMPTDEADPTGKVIDILDAEGDLIESTTVKGPVKALLDAGGVEIEPADGSYVCAPVWMTAPNSAGPLKFSALLRAADGAPASAIAQPLEVIVQAHKISLSVWDLPPTVEPSGTFRYKVGLSCDHGCDLSSRTIRLTDADGALIQEASPSPEIWPGTQSMRFAEMVAVAPAENGAMEWTTNVDADPSDPLHLGAQAKVRFQVSPAPEFSIKVEAVDSLTGEKISGASVVAHPYRAATDDDGIAVIKVHAGSCRLFVTGPSHRPRRFDADVSKDLWFRAALTRDEGFTDADLW